MAQGPWTPEQLLQFLTPDWRNGKRTAVLTSQLGQQLYSQPADPQFYMKKEESGDSYYTLKINSNTIVQPKEPENMNANEFDKVTLLQMMRGVKLYNVHFVNDSNKSRTYTYKSNMDLEVGDWVVCQPQYHTAEIVELVEVPPSGYTISWIVAKLDKEEVKSFTKIDTTIALKLSVGEAQTAAEKWAKEAGIDLDAIMGPKLLQSETPIVPGPEMPFELDPNYPSDEEKSTYRKPHKHAIDPDEIPF